MRLGDGGQNFEDRTGWGPMLTNLFASLNPTLEGAPGGYNNWLKNSLKDLSPQDYYLMKKHKLTIEDIQRLKALMNKDFPLDTSAYPYKQPGE